MNSVISLSINEAGLRNSYHTNIKLLVKYDLLPDDIISSIPKSNIYRWKNTDFSSVIGSDLCQLIENDKQRLIELMQYKKFIKACISVIRIKNIIIDGLKQTKRKIKDLKIKENIIRTIDRTKDSLSLDRAVRYFHISIHQYYLWSQEIKSQCLETFIGLCPRIYPNQLTKKEVNTIKQYLQDIQYKAWSIYSVAYECIKKGILYVSVASWYKYAKLLGISRPIPRHRRKNHIIGIRASHVAEKIHADVTLFRTMDNQINYIYIIMDNFSRFIFGYKVSQVLSPDIMIENLKEVYYKYLLPLSKSIPIELIVDGGIENNNDKMESFLANDIHQAIKKLVAQKDIIFSNSMVESVNKTLKYRFLFQQDVPDYSALAKYMDKAIPIYNSRPHSALKGLAPKEVLKGIFYNIDEHKKHFKEAFLKRIEENRKARCLNCDDTLKNPVLPEIPINSNPILVNS